MKDSVIEKIKRDILGKPYKLSFAFIGVERSKSLNKTYRKENKATDVLSFPLEKNSGEILICKEVAKKKAKKFGMSFENYLIFLVIHGSLHLKGLRHGAKMEKHELTYYSRYRHRDI